MSSKSHNKPGAVGVLQFLVLVQICMMMMIPYVSSLNLIESEAFEEECIDLNVLDVSLDYLWVMEHSVWYFPLMSRLDMYRTSMDLLRKPVANITEEELTSACTKVTWEGFTPKIYGFGGKELEYEFNSEHDNTFTFSGDWRQGAEGKMFLTKTDNTRYIVFVKCWGDGQMSWQVMSIEKTLRPEDKDDIIKHINQLGLAKLSYFVLNQNYTNCFTKQEL